MNVHWGALAAVAVLSGCNSGLGYVEANYGGRPFTDVHTSDGTFQIQDHPDAGKMLTIPSVGDILTHPPPLPGTTIIVEVDPIMLAHQSAAKQWFLQSGRNCTIIKSVEIVRPEFEHTYVCK